MQTAYKTALSGKWNNAHKGRASRLTAREVLAMRSWSRDHPELSQSAKAKYLAKNFKVHETTAVNVLKRETWVHLPEPF